MILKNVSYVQEKINLDGKKELVLFINCDKCVLRKEQEIPNGTCFSCIISSLFLHKNNKLNSISLNNKLIDSYQVKLLLEYSKKIKKFKKLIQKILNVRKTKCHFAEFKCGLSPAVNELTNIKESDYFNPLYVYNLISEIEANFKIIQLTNLVCQNCFSYIEKTVKRISKSFLELTLIQNYHAKGPSLYERILFNSVYYENKNFESQHQYDTKKEEKVIKTYSTGKYEIYQVDVLQCPYENEKLYKVKAFFEEDKEKDYFKKILTDTTLNIKAPEFDRIIPLEALINIYKDESTKLLKSKYNFPDHEINRIGLLTALKKIYLEKLFPLLVDDMVEEIFLDSPFDFIYINHHEYGRCRTKIKLISKELDRLKTLVRLYSGKRLDLMNPSVKLVIKNNYFHCRFAIDVDPIQLHNFALDIRKLNRNIFTIQDLLKNETLDSLMAAFLYFNVLRRRNITITGETDTGKTTLINALDLLTPKEFRKIYVENVTESLKQLDFGKHQLKYHVDSIEENLTHQYSKSNIIKTLLHRTPDLIYLGEILTREESEAMFHCLAAGLKGFQTIHGNSLNSLINRFLYHFGIDESCLFDLDLLIFMKKDKNRRRVHTIAEINKEGLKEKNYFDSIFIFNPLSKTWKLSKPLFETTTIIELKRYEELSIKRFNTYIEIYNEIFSVLSNIDSLDTFELIDLFHKISYHSFISIDS
ncbi:MAG: ATPase, T2SS/T4P/T4SS family, partial [Candidatus Thorarchaeota archaeon]